ncbi:MAG: folylpolyglutamate synthase/dihydrofolate synthase family protein [Thiohalospira sp.]
MRFSRLADWLAWQETLHPSAWDPGLERLGRVVEGLGLVRLPSTVITVGGTNGKGSVIAFLEAFYRAAGYSTGAFTSPHIHRYNERLRLNGEPADDAAWITAFDRVDRAREGDSLTYFEFNTLGALDILAREAPDVALLEVGLGGRLDAVNATTPDVAVITTVDLDHQAWLGDDREAIGGEKAGIFRPGVPAIVGDPQPPASVVGRARALGAPLWRAGVDFGVAEADSGWRWWGDGERGDLPEPALAGTIQRQNAATALAAVAALANRLPVTDEALRTGLASARLPGRFERRPGPVPLILDVAHNPQATRALAAGLRAEPCLGRTLAVVAMLGDKAAASALAPLAAVVDGWFPAALPGFRGRTAVDMAAAVSEATGGAAQFGLEPAEEPEPDVALARARAAAGAGDRIVVFGSFQTLARALPE